MEPRHLLRLEGLGALVTALAGVGLWLDSTVAVQVAAIWAGHIGADRALGYGLKFPTGFTDTHLGRQPVPVAVLPEGE